MTNTATGESVRAVTHVVLQDLKVTNSGDGTLTSITLRAARDVHIHDGHVIARGAVLQHYRVSTDHGGTPSDPSDDEWLAQVLIKQVGNTPDLCTTIMQTIG